MSKAVHIQYVHFDQFGCELSWRKYLNRLPVTIKKRALKFRHWPDSARFVLGKILLLDGVQQFYPGFTLEKVRKTEYGRPFFEAPFDFNITHSDGLIVCAFSEQCRIGIDAEKIRPLDLNSVKSALSNAEWEKVLKSDHPELSFYESWVSKECVAKADGRGLYIEFNELKVGEERIDHDECQWWISPIKLMEDYVVKLATDFPAPKVYIKEFELS